MERDISLSRTEAFDILAAIEEGIDLATSTGAVAVQFQLEDAFAVLRDKLFSDLPEAR